MMIANKIKAFIDSIYLHVRLEPYYVISDAICKFDRAHNKRCSAGF